MTKLSLASTAGLIAATIGPVEEPVPFTISTYNDAPEIAAFVDPDFVGLSDGSISAPHKLATEGLAGTVTGDTIALKSGKIHAVAEAAVNPAGRSIVSYGSDSEKPQLSAMLDLSSNVWTHQGSNVYQTTMTRLVAATPNGGGITASNTFLPLVLHTDGTLATWVRGGSDIAANVATLSSESEGFVMHQTGSTNPDPNSDTSGTKLDYTLYYKAPNGADPTGSGVRVSNNRNIIALPPGRKFQNLSLVGGDGKDAMNPDNDYSGAPTEFKDCARLYPGEHSGVGPMSSRGIYKVLGRPIAGRQGADLGRGGDAWDFFLNTTAHQSTDLTHETVDLSDLEIGFYGHGSSSAHYYNSIQVQRYIVENVKTAFQSDSFTDTHSFFLNQLFDRVELDNIDYAFVCGGNLTINSGSIVFGSAVSTGTAQSLFSMRGAAPVVRVSDLGFSFGLDYVASSTRYELFRRRSSANEDAPKFFLNNVHDLSTENKRGKLPRVGGAELASKVCIVLQETQVWSLQDQAAGANLPSGLYAGPDSQFGLGDRPGLDCDAALSAAGLVENEELAAAGEEGYFWLDPQSTVVDRAHSIVSAPGWK